MFVHTRELFKGMSQEAVGAVKKVLVEELRDNGTYLYKSGDRAGRLYILEEGCVTLTYGSAPCIVYSLDKGGELFGLSSLVRGAAYRGTAQCQGPTRVTKVEAATLEKLFGQHPDLGRTFYEYLVGTIFEKMIEVYNSLLSSHQGLTLPSYG